MAPFFLQQLSLQTIDVVRKATRSNLLNLEIFEGLPLGLLCGAPSDLTVHALHLHPLKGFSGGGEFSLEEALLPVQVSDGVLMRQGLLSGFGCGFSTIMARSLRSVASSTTFLKTLEPQPEQPPFPSSPPQAPKDLCRP